MFAGKRTTSKPINPQAAHRATPGTSSPTAPASSANPVRVTRAAGYGSRGGTMRIKSARMELKWAAAVNANITASPTRVATCQSSSGCQLIAPTPRATRMAASMTNNGIMIVAIVMLDPRPDLGHRLAEPAADPHGTPVLIRHAAPAVEGGGALDRLEQGAQPLLGASDHDQHASVPAARTPEPVVIVAADRRRKALAPAQQVDGAGDEDQHPRRPQPGEALSFEQLLDADTSGREQPGVSGCQVAGTTGAGERQDEKHAEIDPSKQPVLLAIRVEQEPGEAAQPQRQRERMHHPDLTGEEVERSDVDHFLGRGVVDEFKGRPAVSHLPEDVRGEEGESDPAAEPGPRRRQPAPLRRSEEPDQKTGAQPEDADLVGEAEAQDQTQQKPEPGIGAIDQEDQ